MRNFTFPNIHRDCHSASDIDRVDFDILFGNVSSDNMHKALHGRGQSLIYSKWDGQVIEVLVNEPFGTNDHCSIRLQIMKDNNRAIPRVKILNWRKANFDDMRQILAQVHWSTLVAGKGMWNAFYKV